MKGLGAREVVGLGMLAVALVLAFFYLDPASSESRQTAPGEIQLGQTPTPTPIVAPTATPTPPPRAVGAPSGDWVIGTYADAFSGGRVLITQTASTTLNLFYKAAPFPDMKDDAWSVRAEASFTLPPGRYVLKFEHEGAIMVTVDDAQILAEQATTGPQVAEATFEHAGGAAKVRVEARDLKGPFRLKVVE